jgi:hypothetical protein
MLAHQRIQAKKRVVDLFGSASELVTGRADVAERQLDNLPLGRAGTERQSDH